MELRLGPDRVCSNGLGRLSRFRFGRVQVWQIIPTKVFDPAARYRCTGGGDPPSKHKNGDYGIGLLFAFGRTALFRFMSPLSEAQEATPAISCSGHSPQQLVAPS
jgi:hypothetical protein